MKTVFTFGTLFLIFMITLLIQMDINSILTRKTELQDATQISMRNVLKANSINKMYEMTEEEMNVELIRNMAENINTDSEVRINILETNKNGLMDIVATSTFQHLNGVEGSRSIRKTMLVEQYEKNNE